MNISKASLASYGVFFLATGITFSSIFYGPQSGQYYVSIALGAISSFPFFLARIQKNNVSRVAILFVILLPIIVYLLQDLSFSFSGDYEASLINASALSATLYIAIVAGLLPSDRFKNSFSLIAIAHFFVLAYGVYKWDFVAAQADQTRFSALEFREAVWAEIALGAIVAAVLTERLQLIVPLLLVGGMVIFGTQMRGMGLSALALIVVYTSLRFKKKFRAGALYIALPLVILSLVFLYTPILEIFTKVLLLDNPHRGIDSGFSGRFDNWIDGLSKFSEHPLTGVGSIDEVAGYTHNGYIKIFAQYGAFFGIPFLVFLMMALKKAYYYKNKNPEILASLVAYLVFIASTPRYINLQLMPLVAIFAVAYGLLSMRGIQLAYTNMPDIPEQRDNFKWTK